jgi:hypothetical protein
MLIIALVLAVIGLAALVTAVVTSNELIAWVCIGASVLGVVLLIVDALRERSRSAADKSKDETAAAADAGEDAVHDYPDEPAEAQTEAEPAAESEPSGESEPSDEACEAAADQEAGEVNEAGEVAEGDEHDAEPAADEATEEHKS